MLLKSESKTFLFISTIELLELYKSAIEKIKHIKIGDSLTIYENKDFIISIDYDYDLIEYNKLIEIDKLLKYFLIENKEKIKQIDSEQVVFRSSKNGGDYYP